MLRTDLARRGLDLQDLEFQVAVELPERAAMSLINANIAVPINAAVALNLLSDASNAAAGAVQSGSIDQGLIRK